jgi:hypothetical protein
MTRTLATVGVVAVLMLGWVLFFRTPSGALPGSISRPARPSMEAKENVPAAVPGTTPRVETPVQDLDRVPSPAWLQADEATIRLSPAAFPEIPVGISGELKRRGCTVPQTYNGEPPHNVIRGRFMSAAATDWAVLCSRDRLSSILVFPSGSANSVVELAQSPDANWLQGIGGSAIGFSRAIGVATPESIRNYYEAHGGPAPPPLDHDGIDEAFVGKSSVVLYWYNDRWQELTGAD